MSTESPATETVDFWFDPLCPWAWLTSRWILEVTEVRDVQVRWHTMSLAILNEGRELSDEYKKLLTRGPVRVAEAARAHAGEDAVGAFYTAIGTRFHPGGEERSRATAEKALADIGLPVELAEAWDSDAHDATLLVSHEDGMQRVGMEVGTPIVAIGDAALFGPVVTPIPRGEAAGRLWDGVLAVARTPGFYELKRTRDESPSFG